MWVDPNLLSMVGLGLMDDPDVPDGRHLRWFPGRYVGFPRSGFQLRRHTSLVNAGWDANPPPPLIRRQATGDYSLGAGGPRRFPSGLTIAKVGGFTYQPVDGPNQPMRVDAQPVTLDFGPEGPGPTFPPGPNRSNPAAFVRLTVQRRKRTGYASAVASYNAHPELRYQDSGSVGPPVVGWLPPHLQESVLETALGWRVPSSAERLMPERSLAEHDLRAGTRARIVDPNGWVSQTILLHGAFLEHVEITGSDAALAWVQWVTVRDYAGDQGWDDVDTFFLPLTDDPAIYPQWTAMAGEEVAFNRLQVAPPNRILPWDDNGLAVETNLKLRYLGEAFADMDDAMRTFLKGEIAGNVPQAEVELVQELEDYPPSEGSETVTTSVRPFDHLYAAAADPQVARVLGLMTTDVTDKSGIYDYMVHCSTPWERVQWSLDPLGALPRTLPVAGATASREILVAIATGIARSPGLPPVPPAGLDATVLPDLNAQPMPARVELSWEADRRGTYENGGASSVFYELRRRHGTEQKRLHHKDEDSGLLLPHLPTQRLPRDGRLRLVDRNIPAWDTYTWTVRGMDLWGRFSPDAEVTAEVRDTIPPPAPTSLDVRLDGPAAEAPQWEGVTVSFDWTAQQELIAPDLDRFEIQLVQRPVDRVDEANPATWGRFEHVPAAVSPPVAVRWPSLAVGSLPPGVTASVVATPIPVEEGGGQRLAVELGPVSVPFAAPGVAVVSVTVQAVDMYDNAGPLAAHGVARRFDETPPVVPVMPGDVRLASTPDTLGRAALKIEWPALGAGQVRVMRGAGSALLAAAGADMAAYAQMDRTQRAQALRSAAIGHREVFVADHEMPYPGGAGSHVAHLNAGETGLTVFTVEATSAAGLRAAWPSSGSAFVVAAVPLTRAPEPPLVTEARPGDRQVTIRIAPDPSNETTLVRLYRSRGTGALHDVRSMRLVREVPAPPGGQEIQIDDQDVYSEVDYWYRAVALGAAGSSSPSAAVLGRPFTTLAPQPPVILEAKRVPAGARTTVRAQIARRDFPLFLLRRVTGAVGWKPGSGTGIGPDGRIDMTVLAAQPGDEGYELTIQDEVPVGTVFRYLMRTRDPQGRESDSNEMEEVP